MMDWRRHSERTVAAAMALALQAALYLLLMPPHLSRTSAKGPPALVAMILNAARPPRPVLAPPPASRLAAPTRVIQPLAVRPISPPKVALHASAPTIDWRAGIQHEVGAELSRAYAPPKVRFAFPPMPAKKVPPVFDGWDELRIHRGKRLANGIFDIGRCVITLSFPIPICHFGRTHAKGDLFKHMHQDRRTVGALP